MFAVKVAIALFAALALAPIAGALRDGIRGVIERWWFNRTV